MSEDLRLAWYQRLWEHIRREAEAATAAELFSTPEAMHTNLIGASMEYSSPARKRQKT